MRGGQSEILRRIGASFPGLRALLDALAILLTVLIAALWPTAPAYAQSVGCRAVNDGFFNHSGVTNATGSGNSHDWIAGEHIVLTHTSEAGPAAGYFLLHLINWDQNTNDFEDRHDFNGSAPANFTLQGTVPVSAYANLAWIRDVTNYDVVITVTCTPATPVITNLSANSGYTAGGDIIQIGGTGFYPTTQVLIDGVDVASSRVTYYSETRIDVSMPPHARGPVQIGLRSGSVTSGTQTYTYLAPGALSVTDSTGFSSVGPFGGPFAPVSKTWTLSNTGDEDIEIEVAAIETFFDVSGVTVGVPFTLAPNDTRDLTATLNASADLLGAGSHPGSLSITNRTNGTGSTTRAVALAIQMLGSAVSLTSNTDRAIDGDEVAFTAGVQPAGASGEVAFFVNGAEQGRVPLNAGTAIWTTNLLGVGVHEVVAHYLGDQNHAASASSILRQEIIPNANATLQEIAAFLEARASVLLANMPNAQRRFARLRGEAASVSSPGSVLMSYLPVLVNGGTLSGSASLAQIEAMAGNEQQPRLDAWIDGTFGLYSNNGAQGRFGLVALGADYLVNDDLLIGGFFQIDQLVQDNGVTGATAGGTGWMAGPYVTARLSDNLYFDFMAAGGQAENRVSPLGTYEDWYGSTRFLASATLQGEWSYGAWTFAPVASATWFSETSNAYTDSRGVAIPSTSVEKGQFAAGPGVRHVQDIGGGVTLSTSARFEAVAGYRNSLLAPGLGTLHGRISGGLDFGFEGGAALAFSLSHDGLFGTGSRSTAANIRFSVPLH